MAAKSVESGGLIPKKEVLADAFMAGPEGEEYVVECPSDDSCERWIDAVTRRSKDCLKAVYRLPSSSLFPLFSPLPLAIASFSSGRCDGLIFLSSW